jgi:hypothetical protein
MLGPTPTRRSHLLWYWVNCVLIVDAGTRTQEEIAFTVKLRTHGHAGDNPLVFTQVVTNIGGTYSTTTGKFTCSQRGVYVFSTTLIAYNDYHVDGYIVKNGVNQLEMYSVQPRSSGYNYPSASGQVVLSLVVGDQVWVRTVYALVAYSSFSGFVLYST